MYIDQNCFKLNYLINTVINLFINLDKKEPRNNINIKRKEQQKRCH